MRSQSHLLVANLIQIGLKSKNTYSTQARFKRLIFMRHFKQCSTSTRMNQLFQPKSVGTQKRIFLSISKNLPKNNNRLMRKLFVMLKLPLRKKPKQKNKQSTTLKQNLPHGKMNKIIFLPQVKLLNLNTTTILEQRTMSYSRTKKTSSLSIGQILRKFTNGNSNKSKIRKKRKLLNLTNG